MAQWYSREAGGKFEGVFSLLLTPFHENGEVNWQAYDRYVEWQLERKPHGLFGVCGSSEMKWLTLEEREQLASRAAKLAGNVPVVVTGNLGSDPASHGEKVKRMADTGAAAIVLVPPDGMGVDQQALGDYYAKLADSAPIPCLVYEWPMVQAYLLDTEVYEQLANHHNVWGIKDTTCTREGIKGKIDAAPDSVVYQANHPYMLEAVRMGARGIMAISSASSADLVLDFWQKAIRQDPEAERLHRELVVLDSMLTGGGAYPMTSKLIAQLQGMDIGLTCRNPVRLKPDTAHAVKAWYTGGSRA
ncbi:dihydrodipicolinate synthase family protein [Paenibacillus sp. J5C_2022]|uniref:dihydrodipicolinate synthase family protein n=1 Tax=Paenibacillus sp. J5C2022 TaxID=2977129 RepID=UPI0021D3A8D6|nr:dihydrodipicolinate synthase family protein [Paenibacillus sp. J5C2022]MCU6709134.1 dihydrodipicolinate synthase family protein [Paenibacillus sp. J5C2022]